jgi:DNA-binding Lrp family transcriptional regulator
MRGPTIRHHLSQLRDRGVVRNSTCFLNPYRLGLSGYTMYFSLASAGKSVREQLVRLTAASSVEWVAELAGEHSYGVSLLAESPAELPGLVSRISEICGNLICNRVLLMRIRFVAFGRKYLSDVPAPIIPLTIEHTSTRVTTDATDRRILGALSQGECPSLREMASSLQIPASTLRHRLKRLEADQVIQGFIYRYNLAQMGAQSFRICITTKGGTRRGAKELFEFAKNHPNIVHFIEYMGPWDYELGVEVQDARDINQVIAALYERFEPIIGGIKTFTILHNIKYCAYPFDQPVERKK